MVARNGRERWWKYRFRPILEALEDRWLPSTSYLLSPNGVLKEKTNGVVRPILTEVVSFAVDRAGDVFALRTDHTLNEKHAGESAWHVFGYSVVSFSLDVSDDTVVALLEGEGRAVWQASASAANANGYGLWAFLGRSGVIAADGSMFFFGSEEIDSSGNYAVYRYADGEFIQTSGAGIWLSAVGDSVWCLKQPRQLWHWDGQGWELWQAVFDSGSRPTFLVGSGAGDRAIYSWEGWDVGPVRLPGKATALGYFGGTLCSLNRLNEVAVFDGSSWVRQESVTLAGEGTFFLFPSPGNSDGTHRVLRWNNGQLMSTLLQDSSVYLEAAVLGKAEGTLWAWQPEVWVLRWSGQDWVRERGSVTEEGDTWFLGSASATTRGDHFIYRFHEGRLIRMSGAATGLTEGEGTIFVANGGNKVRRWGNARWQNISTVQDGEGGVWFLGKMDMSGRGDRLVYKVHQGIPGRMPGSTAAALLWAEGKVWALPGVPDYAAESYAAYWGPSGWVNTEGVTTSDRSLWFLGTPTDDAGNRVIYRYRKGRLTRLPGQAIDLIAVGTEVWLLDSRGQVLRWRGDAWAKQADGMRALARLGPNGPLYAVTASGQLVRRDGSAWTVAANGMQAAGDGSFWGLGDQIVWDGGYTIYRVRDGELSGHGYAVSLGVLDGDVYIVDSRQELFRWAEGYWTGPGLSGRVVAPDGSIWFLGNGTPDGAGQHDICRFHNGRLERMPGGAVRLVGVAEGTVWALGAGDRVLRWTGSTWAEQPSALDEHGNVWTLGTTDLDGYGDRALYRISNGMLQRMTGEAAALLSGRPAGGLFAANARLGQIWRNWNYTSWSVVPSVAAADGNRLFLGWGTRDANGNQPIFRFLNGQIVQAPGYAAAIASVEGMPWVRTTLGEVHRWNGAGWTRHSAALHSDGTVWFLGSAHVTAQGDRTIYRWVNDQVIALPGHATGVWRAGNAIWVMNSASQLYFWNGSAWVEQAALTPAEGGFQLTGVAPVPVLLTNLPPGAVSGEALAEAMPHIVNLQQVAFFGPNSPIGRAIIRQYTDAGAASLKRRIQDGIDAEYASHLDELYYGPNWGNTITQSVWDGFNRDGTSHYREVVLNHGQWRRRGVGRPTVEDLTLEFRTFDAARNQWTFHFEAVIDVPLYLEAQNWSFGVDYYHVGENGKARMWVSFDLIVTPRFTYDAAARRLTADLGAVITGLQVPILITFGHETLGSWMASAAAVFPSLLLSSSLGQLVLIDRVQAAAASYLQEFRGEAYEAPGRPGKVQWNVYYGNDLVEGAIL